MAKADDAELLEIDGRMVRISSPMKPYFARDVQLTKLDIVRYFVRRAKARFSSGCESRPAAFAPAGSNRSSRGGNEAAEASGVEGHYVTWRVCRP